MAEGEFPPSFDLELPATVRLVRCEDGLVVEAQLVELTAKLAKLKINGAWWTGLGISKTQRSEEADHHWNWAAEVGKHHNQLYFESVAIQTTDRAIQGAVIYRVDGRSVLQDGAGAILSHWLATAPRNRPWMVPLPEHRGIGTNLVCWAANHSYRLGFGGRIVLATLPSQRTTNFYKSLGFRATSAEAPRLFRSVHLVYGDSRE
jgi:hypothetical protein